MPGWLTKSVRFSTMILLSMPFLTATKARFSFRLCTPEGQYNLNPACERFLFPKNGSWIQTTPPRPASSAEIVDSYPFPQFCGTMNINSLLCNLSLTFMIALIFNFWALGPPHPSLRHFLASLLYLFRLPRLLFFPSSFLFLLLFSHFFLFLPLFPLYVVTHIGESWRDDRRCN